MSMSKMNTQGNIRIILEKKESAKLHEFFETAYCRLPARLLSSTEACRI